MPISTRFSEEWMCFRSICIDTDVTAEISLLTSAPTLCYSAGSRRMSDRIDLLVTLGPPSYQILCTLRRRREKNKTRSFGSKSGKAENIYFILHSLSRADRERGTDVIPSGANQLPLYSPFQSETENCRRISLLFSYSFDP